MRLDKSSLREEYLEKKAWGLLTSIDLHSCDGKTIRDASKIKQFVVELCELIKMKRFGECQVVHFGEDEEVAGFSMTQLIETSLISGHFANKTNNVYLDVFSCKFYEPKVVADFAKKFFKAKKYNINYCLRK
jgi:S-adenosylmethionine decarboxylase